MSVALRIYEQLTEAGEDKIRAKVIAEAFERLEDQYPHLKDVATNSQVRETELRLQREIAEVESRLEIKTLEVEARLLVQIEQIKVSVAETRADLVRWVVGVGILQSSVIIAVLMKVAHLI